MVFQILIFNFQFSIFNLLVRWLEKTFLVLSENGMKDSTYTHRIWAPNFKNYNYSYRFFEPWFNFGHSNLYWFAPNRFVVTFCMCTGTAMNRHHYTGKPAGVPVWYQQPRKLLSQVFDIGMSILDILYRIIWSEWLIIRLIVFYFI